MSRKQVTIETYAVAYQHEGWSDSGWSLLIAPQQRHPYMGMTAHHQEEAVAAENQARPHY